MSKKIKTHVVLPLDLLETIDSVVGKRRRSRFFREAAEEKIKRDQFLKALKESAGAWKDENHPELSSIEDISKYVRELREGGEERLK